MRTSAALQGNKIIRYSAVTCSMKNVHVDPVFITIIKQAQSQNKSVVTINKILSCECDGHVIHHGYSLYSGVNFVEKCFHLEMISHYEGRENPEKNLRTNRCHIQRASRDFPEPKTFH